MRLTASIAHFRLRAESARLPARTGVYLCAMALLGLLLVPGVALAAPGSATPPTVSSARLIETPGFWDGKDITFTGEAIGEAMIRGDIAWLHLNDDPYAYRTIPEGSDTEGYNAGLAIVVPAHLAERIGAYGSYRVRGDLVTVSGVFRAADPAHGGDMLIQADALQIVAPGKIITEKVSPRDIRLLWLSAAAALMALFAFWRSRPE